MEENKMRNGHTNRSDGSHAKVKFRDFIMAFLLSFLCCMFWVDSIFASSLQFGDEPMGVAIDPSTNTAVIANKKDNAVSIVDLAGGVVVATIPVGGHPVGVAIDHQGRSAVVLTKRAITSASLT